MEEINNNDLKIGDYVEFYSYPGFEPGVVIGFFENNIEWPFILCLENKRISDPVYFERLKKTDLPEKYKNLYTLLKVNNFSSDISDYLNFMVQLETHFGAKVWTNPIMDTLRKVHCLCLNCENMKTCPTAHELYEISKREDMAMAITRCRSFKGKE